MKKLCIYHANCADGFGAAWIVRKALGPDEVEFCAALHHREPPDVTGREVIMVDFSYPRRVMEQLLAKAAFILLLDHHITARDDLTGLKHPKKLMAVFDMDLSGVGVTWRHFFPGQPMPKLLAHVQDMDLWRFGISGTREIMSTVHSHPYDFAVWDQLMKYPPYRLIRDGMVLRRARDKEVSDLLGPIGIAPRFIQLGHKLTTLVRGPAYNVPFMFSGVANKAAETHPFAATYWISGERVKFSLRSREDGGVDVAALAQQYGGGGHVHAAGFELQLSEALQILQ
jgi:oligoribonuclease NrnB/cAMP/cGMP phosphodiesterase (DHH superfamily)